MTWRNRILFAPDGAGAAGVIAGGEGGAAGAGGAGGAGGAAGAGGAGGAGGATFAWPADLDAPIVDLLKSKGMYDDPVKGVPMLAKSYYDTNRVLSGNPDVLPVPDWTKEDATEKFFGKTRGVAKPEEYEAKFSDGTKTVPELVDFSKKLAFMWGVPKALMQKGIDAWEQFAATQNANYTAAQSKANDDQVNALKTKHGEAVFTQHVANAQNVFKALSAKGLVSKDTLAAVQNNIGSGALLELMFAIGQGMKEAPVVGNGGTAALTDPSQMTPEQALAEINRLMADKEFLAPYNDAKNSQHAVAVERMKNLFAVRARRSGT